MFSDKILLVRKESCSSFPGNRSLTRALERKIWLFQLHAKCLKCRELQLEIDHLTTVVERDLNPGAWNQSGNDIVKMVILVYIETISYKLLRTFVNRSNAC